MRVLVCGGRDYTDAATLCRVLDGLEPRPTFIIEGEARGADQLAALWAFSHSIVILPFHADWKKHGLSAGPIRNRQMLIEGRSELVVAFPGGRGTANMIKQARQAGVKVMEIK